MAKFKVEVVAVVFGDEPEKPKTIIADEFRIDDRGALFFSVAAPVGDAVAVKECVAIFAPSTWRSVIKTGS